LSIIGKYGEYLVSEFFKMNKVVINKEYDRPLNTFASLGSQIYIRQLIAYVEIRRLHEAPARSRSKECDLPHPYFKRHFGQRLKVKNTYD